VSRASTPIPDLTAHLDAAERAAASLSESLLAALASTPTTPDCLALRNHLGEALTRAETLRSLSYVRGILAEMARVKGPMVEVCYPHNRGGVSRGSAELAEVTGAALVMRNGDRYSRRTGREVGYERPRWGDPAPYITAEERARVLALHRPTPATPAVKKAPK